MRIRRARDIYCDHSEKGLDTFLPLFVINGFKSHCFNHS